MINNKNKKIIKTEEPITKEFKGKNNKKQKSLDKNKNINFRNSRNYNDEYFGTKDKRRNQSFQKRTKRIKI